MQPGQLIEVLKGVFGLSTSPKLWWMKLSKEVLTIEIHHQGLHLTMQQNEIDPCVFMVCSQSTETTVHGLLLTHVDDDMLMAERELVPLLQKALQDRFPVDEWVSDEFEYVGCEYKCSEQEVRITQKHYTLWQSRQGHCEAQE